MKIISIITLILATINGIRAFLNMGQTPHIVVGLLWLCMSLSIIERLTRKQ